MLEVLRFFWFFLYIVWQLPYHIGDRNISILLFKIDCRKVLNRFKVLDVLARSGGSYYVQEVCTQFEPIQMNVVRTIRGIN